MISTETRNILKGTQHDGVYLFDQKLVHNDRSTETVLCYNQSFFISKSHHHTQVQLYPGYEKLRQVFFLHDESVDFLTSEVNGSASRFISKGPSTPTATHHTCTFQRTPARAHGSTGISNVCVLSRPKQSACVE